VSDEQQNPAPQPGQNPPPPRNQPGQNPAASQQPPAPNPYEQPSPYSQANPYQPADPYQEPNPYQLPGVGSYQEAPQGYSYPPAVQARSPMMGRIALLLSVLALVAGVVSGVGMGEGYGLLIQQGAVDINSGDVDPSKLGDMSGVGIWVMLMMGGFILGVVGLILGIVAMAQRRGRGTGVGAILVAIVAPFVMLSVMIMGLAPYIP